MAKAKHKKAPKDTSAMHSDFGTPYRSRQGPVVIEKVPADMEDTQNRDRARAIEIDDPLYLYRRNRIISVTQRDAGLVLRELWNRTGKEPRVICQYSDQIGGGSISSLRIDGSDHVQKFVEAIRAVGPIGSDPVMSVVCMQTPVPKIEYEILRRGLDILAKKWGLT